MFAFWGVEGENTLATPAEHFDVAIHQGADDGFFVVPVRVRDGVRMVGGVQQIGVTPHDVRVFPEGVLPVEGGIEHPVDAEVAGGVADGLIPAVGAALEDDFGALSFQGTLSNPGEDVEVTTCLVAGNVLGAGAGRAVDAREAGCELLVRRPGMLGRAGGELGQDGQGRDKNLGHRKAPVTGQREGRLAPTPARYEWGRGVGGLKEQVSGFGLSPCHWSLAAEGAGNR